MEGKLRYEKCNKWNGGKRGNARLAEVVSEHELRAALTSEAMLKNDRVVLEVKDALKAANELDQALKEIR